MSRKNRTPEENARRAKIRELLQMGGISSMDDIQNLFKETIAEFMENGLDAELDDELGYSKYDYKNKDTDNSRNGHSSKTLRRSPLDGLPTFRRETYRYRFRFCAHADTDDAFLQICCTWFFLLMSRQYR